MGGSSFVIVIQSFSNTILDDGNPLLQYLLVLCLKEQNLIGKHYFEAIPSF